MIEAIRLDGWELRAGSRVRLAPRRTGGDLFETVLDGRAAIVHEILEDEEGRVRLAVIVSDDPGRDLGALRRPGHRFFFDPDEVVPLAVPDVVGPRVRVLVAGIGNVFLGDDGWGVALAGRLSAREQPTGVDVADFGIRGMDLGYAMGDGYDVVVLLDAAPRGQPPGTVSVIEPQLDDVAPAVDAHGMDPVKVLALARALADRPLPRTLVVACEPTTRMRDDDERIVAELTDPVRAALDTAVPVVEELLRDLTREEPAP